MGSQVALQELLACLVGINSGPVLYFFSMVIVMFLPS